jgi:EpsI family protein
VKSTARSWIRFFPVALALVITASVLHARKAAEILPARQDLDSFPLQIGAWQGTPLPLGADELQVLGPGHFLLRDYRNPMTAQPVNLYIAYFPSQRTGDTIHSPKNCLPGAGWTPLESGRLQIQNVDGSSMSVNRYVVGKGPSRALVLYWYQAHGRITASEYWAKIRLVQDAVRMNRTDGSLIRVVVPFDMNREHDDVHAAQDIALSFVGSIQPLLERYIPR